MQGASLGPAYTTENYNISFKIVPGNNPIDYPKFLSIEINLNGSIHTVYATYLLAPHITAARKLCKRCHKPECPGVGVTKGIVAACQLASAMKNAKLAHVARMAARAEKPKTADALEALNRDAARAAEGKEAAECTHYLEGKCSHGGACNYSHVTKPDTIQCAMGDRCPRARRPKGMCYYAHECAPGGKTAAHASPPPHPPPPPPHRTPNQYHYHYHCHYPYLP